MRCLWQACDIAPELNSEFVIDNSFVSEFALLTVTEIEVSIPGDVNQDGVVSLLDVAPFVELITNSDFQFEADTNKDGSVDLLDIQPFIDLLN